MKKGILFIVTVLFVISSCKKKDESPESSSNTTTPTETAAPITNDPALINFSGPSYADNYTSIAAWSSRSSWNLANVHDPTVAKSGDYYYMYQTDASYGNAHEGHGYYPYRRSKDLVNWEFIGMAFSSVPAWVKDSLNIKRARMSLPAIDNPSYGFWAPCVRKVGNKYRMYYSVVVTNPIVGSDYNTSWTERAFIGLAESDDLASNVWTDKGMVICSEPDGVNTYIRKGGNDWSAYFKFNAIDPSYIVTPEGEHWLIYGSWHTGIAAVKLDGTTGKPTKLQAIADYGVRIAGRGNISTNRWQALEGPEIIYNENTGYYYLFVAYDELSVAYNTRVARSRSITGPYVGIDGNSVTNGAECYPMLTHPYKFNNHTGWVGFSHCALFQNPDTKKWYYASQARLPRDVPGINVSNAVMLGHVREVEWTEDGWPVIMPERYAGIPSSPISSTFLAGKWEMITMQYQYQTMQTSLNITLTADGKVSTPGGSTGTWSFDESKKILTINGAKYHVSYGWDWESSPRKLTLTFSGLTAGGLPVWGKRVL